MKNLEEKPFSHLIFVTIFNFAISFMWIALLTNILPTCVLNFVGEIKKGTYLGILTTAGAAIALFTNPIIGLISDNSSFKIGKRKFFMIYGTFFLTISLLLLTYTKTFILFLISFLLVQFFANFASAPFFALIPDTVPKKQRGTSSGLMGFFNTIGRICGVLIAGYFLGHPEITKKIILTSPYLLKGLIQKIVGNSPLPILIFIIIAINFVCVAITCIKIKEIPQKQKTKRLTLSLFSDAFKFNIKENLSFAYFLLSRGLNFLAIYTLVTFLLYYIKDYLGVGNIEEANQKISFLMFIISIVAVPAAIYSGYLSDKLGKRKILIYISTFIMIASSVLFIIIKTFNMALLIGMVFGFSFGAYDTLSWALGFDLLPKDSYAKNVGIFNIANILPQVIAPAIGGILLDKFNLIRHNLGYQAIFITVIIYLIISTIILVKVEEKTKLSSLATSELMVPASTS